jgi:hypothetical protein
MVGEEMMGARQMSRQRNEDQHGIDWDRDPEVMFGVTAGKVAIFENVDGCVAIVQGTNYVVVGSRDLGELIGRLCELGYRLGYKYHTPPPRDPPRLLPFPSGPGGGNGAT